MRLNKSPDQFNRILLIVKNYTIMVFKYSALFSLPQKFIILQNEKTNELQ